MLIRLHLFIGDGVAQLGLVAIGFDVIEVVVQQSTRRLLIRVDKSPLHFFTCHLVVLFTSFADEVQIALALLASDAGVLVKSIAQSAQGINGIDAGDVLLDERIGEAVDDIAR